MEEEQARAKFIQEIVQLAKDKIDRAGCRSVDTIAWFYFELLRDLGENEEAEKLYKHYWMRWT